MTLRRWVGGAVLLAVGCGPVLAQGLGEAAERERKRREALKEKSGKSYGDDDLAARRPTALPQPTAKPGSAGGGAAATPIASPAPTPTPGTAETPRTPAEMARASMSAPGGLEYHKRAWDRFSAIRRTADETCPLGFGGRATFWIRIAPTGTADDVQFDPPTTYAECLAKALRGQAFPTPPGGTYWFSIATSWAGPPP